MNFFFKTKCRLLFIISALIGGFFSSCTKYGTPYAEYIFEGTVTDTLDRPIKNIEVNLTENGHINNHQQTNSSGYYSMTGEFYDFENTEWEISVEDIDDTLNGEYITATVSFTTNKNDLPTSYKKDDKYDNGTLFRNINFILQEK